VADELLDAFIDDGIQGIVVLKIFGDESGTHRASRVLTVGAYASYPPDWRKFKKVFRRRLKKHGIEVFHSFEFDKWDDEIKAKISDDVFPLIPKFTQIGIAVTLFKHLELAKLQYPKELDFITEEFTRDELLYLFCLAKIVEVFATGLKGRWADEPLAFVFEENDHASVALKCYRWIKQNTEFGREMPSQIAFNCKKDFPQLWAADILAYQANRYWDSWNSWFLHKKGSQPDQSRELTLLNTPKGKVISLPYTRKTYDVQQELLQLAKKAKQWRSMRN
jgi:hypothetical protein